MVHPAGISGGGRLRLYAERPPWIDEGERAGLHETADALLRHLADLDAAKDRAAIPQEHLANHISEPMEQRMSALTMIAAIFLPRTFLTGLLSINVGDPRRDFGWALWIVCGLLVTLGTVQVRLLRRRRWFDQARGPVDVRICLVGPGRSQWLPSPVGSPAGGRGPRGVDVVAVPHAADAAEVPTRNTTHWRCTSALQE